MLMLVVGLIIFFLIHLVPMRQTLRANLVRQLGPGGYKGMFSLISAAGLVLIVLGYAALKGGPVASNPELWSPPVWMSHITLVIMIPAMILLAAAYIPSRIRTAVRHPMLAAVKLWAVAHLLANGDLASVLLFGSFLAYAVVDRISVKHRHAPGPLGDRTGSIGGDIAVIAVGLALYAAFLLFAHQWLFGVAPLPALSA